MKKQLALLLLLLLFTGISLQVHAQSNIVRQAYLKEWQAYADAQKAVPPKETATAKAAEETAFMNLFNAFKGAKPASPALTASVDTALKVENLNKAKEGYAAAQEAADKAATEKKELANKAADSTLEAMIKTYMQMPKTTGGDVKPPSPPAPCPTDCKCEYNKDWDGNGLAWLLVFSPLVIFLIIGGIALSGLKGFKVIDALTENNGTKITIVNPLYIAANLGLPPTAANPLAPPTTLANLSTIIPPTLEVTTFTVPALPAPQIPVPTPDYRPSISRFIALLSTLVIIAVAVSMSCLFIYRYLAYNCPPDFANLSAILIALGIGIVPYAVNKITTAASGNNQPS